VLVEIVAVGLILFLLSSFPTFEFISIFPLVGVVFLALGWGAGPSLLATLVSSFLLYFVVLPPHFTLIVEDPADSIGLVMFLVVGVSISLLAGESERARRQAEEISGLLALAEEGSRSEADRLRTVLDVLPCAVLIASPEGNLLAMNQATRTLWGDDIPSTTDITQFPQGKLWWARTGAVAPLEEWPLTRALSSGETVLNEELEIEAPDGQHHIVLNSAAPLRNEAGAITGAVVSAQDISDLRRLELETAERAHELEAIVEAISDGIAFLDATGRILRANQAYRTLHGVEPDSEFLQLPAEQRMALLALSDDRGQLLPAESRPLIQLLKGETLTGADVKIKNLQGREVVLNVGGAPIRDSFGRISGCVEVFRDVTDRHRLEQRTRESLAAVIAMAEAMVQIRPRIPALEDLGDAATRTGADTPLPAVARRLAELTRSVLECRHASIVAMDGPTGQLRPVTEVGLSADQEQAWWSSWSPLQLLEERYDRAIAATLRAGEPVMLDSQHLPEHSRYTLFGAKTSLVMPMQLGEDLVGMLIVDYFEPGHAYSGEEMLLTKTLARLGTLVLEEDRLLRGWTEARASELALGETKAQMDTFLGIASHELKTPLTSLKLNLQVAKRRLRRLAQDHAAVAGSDTEPQSAVELISRTEHQVERMERLINDLVDVSRIQAGKLELRPGRTDLVAIVREAALVQQQAVPERTIRLQLGTDLSAPVYADAGRIEQVVTNYLTNALKYSPADRPVDVGVELVAPQLVRVWVHDQGPGIPVQEQEHIWERFHRVKGIEVQSGTGVGLGLGLHISRMIVERHQGQVGVESGSGTGTTFWFTLPLSEPEAESS
jgi:PAS domain S-box-containing protein